jgi:Fucose permease
MNAKDASVFLSFGGLGLFMFGRFAGSWIMSRVAAQKVLFTCAVFTVISTLIIVLDFGMVSKVGLLGVYIFESIMFPTIFALSLRNLGDMTKRASSYLMMTPIGGAVGPLLMGYVADSTSMPFSFIVPFMAFVVVMLYASATIKKQL